MIAGSLEGVSIFSLQTMQNLERGAKGAPHLGQSDADIILGSGETAWFVAGI